MEQLAGQQSMADHVHALAHNVTQLEGEHAAALLVPSRAENAAIKRRKQSQGIAPSSRPPPGPLVRAPSLTNVQQAKDLKKQRRKEAAAKAEDEVKQRRYLAVTGNHLVNCSCCLFGQADVVDVTVPWASWMKTLAMSTREKYNMVISAFINADKHGKVLIMGKRVCHECFLRHYNLAVTVCL